MLLTAETIRLLKEMQYAIEEECTDPDGRWVDGTEKQHIVYLKIEMLLCEGQKNGAMTIGFGDIARMDEFARLDDPVELSDLKNYARSYALAYAATHDSDSDDSMVGCFRRLAKE